jgi:L-ribulose-5-phosphate 3-epimerase
MWSMMRSASGTAPTGVQPKSGQSGQAMQSAARPLELWNTFKKVDLRSAHLRGMKRYSQLARQHTLIPSLEQSMLRRSFLKSAVSVCAHGSIMSLSRYHGTAEVTAETSANIADSTLKPMALGLLISPADNPASVFAQVKELEFANCFLSLDSYIGKFTSARAQELRNCLDKYELIATTAEVVGPGPLVWDFIHGPSTIGIVPRETRAARVDALKHTSDFARLVGISNVQTHCGFIPENPGDPLYAETVQTIQCLAAHCAGNGQNFLMDTGQETPVTMLRVLKDVNMPNLGVGLDTANLVLYGKANPVDAVDIIGPYVKSIHAKDGRWPTDPSKLGQETLIGQGVVDFKRVFKKLKDAGYSGPITIEREISGPQQLADIRTEKLYLEKILSKI